MKRMGKMSKRVFIKQISFCLVLTLLACCFMTRSVSALKEDKNPSLPIPSFDTSDVLSYSTYISDYKSENLSEVSSYAKAVECSNADNANIEIRKDKETQ